MTHGVRDMTGQRFGRLTVLRRVTHEGHPSLCQCNWRRHPARTGRRATDHTYWVCECDCGHLTEIRGTRLRDGHTSSCGCWALEKLKKGVGMLALFASDDPADRWRARSINIETGLKRSRRGIERKRAQREEAGKINPFQRELSEIERKVLHGTLPNKG